MPRPDGQDRPLSITSLAWRLGASMINKQLAPWTARWISPTIQGGCIGRGILHSHSRIASACAVANKSGGDFAIVAQDLAKCFDRVNPWQAIAALKIIGLSDEVVTLLIQFYAGLRRVFAADGCFSASWRQYANGILQGCPFSALLLVGAMAIWDRWVQVPDVDKNVFIDDRAMWCSVPGFVEKLMRAAELSASFDTEFGFRLNASKTQVAVNTRRAARLIEKGAFQYGPVKTSVDILGLRHDMQDPHNTKILKLDSRKSEIKLERIRRASGKVRQRRQMVQSFVMPMYLWTSAFVWFTSSEIDSLRKSIRATVVPRAPHGASDLHVWQVWIGAACDPWFATKWSILRSVFAHARRKFHDSGWLADQSFVRGAFFDYAHAAETLLDNLAWEWNEELCIITRRDAYGELRTTHIARDGDNVLKSWLTEEWQKNLLSPYSRIRKSFTRPPDATLARGLDLPVSAGRIVDTWAHELLYSNADSPVQYNLSVATGLNFWFCATKHKGACGGRPADLDKISECMCGKHKPSLAHLVWNCQATDSHRQQACVALPTTRSGERLIAPMHFGLPRPPLGDIDDKLEPRHLCSGHRRE